MRRACLALASLWPLGCGTPGEPSVAPTSAAAHAASDASATSSAQPAPSALDAAEPAPVDVCAEAERAPKLPRPTDPRDLLFHVSRARAIPAEFPVSATSIWSPCSQVGAPPRRSDDLVCVPASYSHLNREALRAAAFESDAPANFSRTHDALPVGRDGKIGFKAMLDDAAAAGHTLRLRSGFRAYTMQSATFSGWVAAELAQGRTREYALRKVDASSARAGHSEHQLGTTADLVFARPNGAFYTGWTQETYAESPAMAWVAANAHRFGLVMSYDKDHEGASEYVWEPWHYRFVGAEAADLMKRCGWSTEQYLELRYGEDTTPRAEHASRSLVPSVTPTYTEKSR